MNYCAKHFINWLLSIYTTEDRYLVVHTCFEEIRLKEGGGKGDGCEHYRGEVSCHHLACDLPLQNDEHKNTILRLTCVPVHQLPVYDVEDGHLLLLLHHQLLWDKLHSVKVQGGDVHLNCTHLCVKRIP